MFFTPVVDLCIGFSFLFVFWSMFVHLPIRKNSLRLAQENWAIRSSHWCLRVLSIGGMLLLSMLMEFFNGGVKSMYNDIAAFLFLFVFLTTTTLEQMKKVDERRQTHSKHSQTPEDVGTEGKVRGVVLFATLLVKMACEVYDWFSTVVEIYI
eukprot:TRINITY_DN1584_c0_g1_i1.p1 TRINITY_DN1584_c0_g1~~TRINITY_DN1584_c0_g1_i1.p1  ORF type:complete len:152 (-),score=48.14 TRINITY_DN1584_c0_g1_i1:400-855(-)